MDDAGPLFRNMDAQDIADLERATGLLIAVADDWSLEEFDAVIAYLRRMAFTSPAFTLHLAIASVNKRPASEDG
jgi:hypothetical protein